jgi:hypothetical protein
MTGSRAVAVVGLLTLATIGGLALGATQSGPTMSVQPVENSSNYLGPNESAVDRSGQATPSLDVAATVSANASRVRSRFSDRSMAAKYGNASTDAERRRVVENETERLARRVEALESRDSETIEGYAAGDVGEAELLRTLAIIDAEAETRTASAEWLESRAHDLDMTAESRRLSTLRIRLMALQGPVRQTVARGLDGSSPSRVHAEVAGGGLVLATVESNEVGETVYTREAYTPAIRNRRDTDRYADFGEVFGRLAEIYPWVNDRSPRVDNSIRIGRPGEGALLYSMQFTYDRGRLTPYLDGGTGRVVKEEQRQHVADLPTKRQTATNPDGDLAVVVETTYASGPLGVNATDPSTGRAVDATVHVDGDPVGTTDGETFWTVAPRGSANVTVAHGDSTATTTVRAP